MQKIAFTLCSNNYLAHAKTLGDSLRLTNPDMKFIIGLTDKMNAQIDYSFFEPYEILPYNKIAIDFFDEMIVKYNVIEFNTAVKPFYFQYLFNSQGFDSIVYYLDPDLFIFSSFSELHTLLKEYHFIVTPHITKAEIRMTRFEKVFLNVGVYNLGFLGLRYSENTQLFLHWWQSRLKDYCYINYTEGLFVDQIWINFIHLFFEGVYILKSPAYNMAYWNLHERKLISVNGSYYVNNTNTPLVFFHFSGFKAERPHLLTKDREGEFTISLWPDLKDLLQDYESRLINNKYHELSSIGPMLNFKPRRVQYSKRQRIGKAIKSRINKMLEILFQV